MCARVGHMLKEPELACLSRYTCACCSHMHWPVLRDRTRTHSMMVTEVREVQVICHGIPDQRPLEDGDIVNVDVTVFLKGYHGDLNETYVVGSVDDASKRLIRVTSEARAARLKKSWLPSAFAPRAGLTTCMRLAGAGQGHSGGAARHAVSGHWGHHQHACQPERLPDCQVVLRPWHRRPVPLRAHHPPLRPQ